MTSTVSKSTTQSNARPRVIALVWAPQEARTALYAKWLHAPLYNVHFLLYKRPYIAPFKYPLQALKTWSILLRERPRVVYVTNPPVFAPLSVWLFSLFSRAKLIIDTHPPSLYSKRWAWTLPLQRFVIKRAYANVTDQARFAKQFESWGGRTVVLAKPPKFLPTIEVEDVSQVDVQPTYEEAADHPLKVFVVNTFAADEPLDIILEAARSLPDVQFEITGDLGLAPAGALDRAPANVKFVGYLKGEAYWDGLRGADAVMVLTTYPYSLLGGAQDAVAVEVPLIVSDQPVLRDVFEGGTVFVPNTTEGIIDGVRNVMRDRKRLHVEIKIVAKRHHDNWHASFAELQQLIEEAQHD